MVIDSIFPDGLMVQIMDGWNRSLKDAVSNGNGTKRELESLPLLQAQNDNLRL